MDNSKTLKDLIDRHKDVLDKAEQIVALAETESRGMSADEKTNFEAFKTEAKRIEDEIEALHRAKTSRDEIDALKRYTVPAVATGVTEERSTEQLPKVEIRENEQR